MANVVEDFQKKQSSRNSINRDRDRSNSRDRINSRDSYRNNNRSRDRSRDRRDSRNNSRDRGRSNSRESRNNQQRSGSGQRYFAIMFDNILKWLTSFSFFSLPSHKYVLLSSGTWITSCKYAFSLRLGTWSVLEGLSPRKFQ